MKLPLKFLVSLLVLARIATAADADIEYLNEFNKVKDETQKRFEHFMSLVGQYNEEYKKGIQILR